MDFTNLEAEKSILGSLIMQNQSLHKVSDVLRGEHFYFDSNQKIYDEILKKINMEKGVADLITLRPFFKTLPEGIEYLGSLAALASSLVPLRDYSFSLIELSNKRNIVNGLKNLLSEADKLSSTDLIAKSQDVLASAGVETSEVEIFNGEDLNKSLLDYWKDGSASVVIPSGLPSLDKMLNGGFSIDKLYTIGAAPGTGKTSLAQQIIINALEKDFGVLFFSMEMEQRNIFARFLANFSEINPFRILINNIFRHEEGSFDNALKKWERLKSRYFMTEKGHLSLIQMESALKRKLRAFPIKLVVVDYLQIMSLRNAKNFNEASLIKENVNGLKELAKKYHVCVIVLSQLTKDGLGGKPGLKALKGSGGIGEDSDCVINLWNDSEEQEHNKTKTINIEVAKNRNGMKGNLVINFDGEFNRFTENNF